MKFLVFFRNIFRGFERLSYPAITYTSSRHQTYNLQSRTVISCKNCQELNASKCNLNSENVLLKSLASDCSKCNITAEFNASATIPSKLTQPVGLKYDTLADHKYYTQCTHNLLGTSPYLRQNVFQTSTWLLSRPFHSTATLYKDPEDIPKVQRTVDVLKEEQKQTKKTEETTTADTSATGAVATTSTTPITPKPPESKPITSSTTPTEAQPETTKPPPPPPPVPAEPSAVVVKKTIWERVKAELKHYYHTDPLAWE